MNRPRLKLLAIGFDAAEIELIEQWINEGALPHLARLREEGAFARLGSTAAELSASPWASFNTGRPPADHNIWNFLLWNARRMDYASPSPSWLPLEPFWRELSRRGTVCAAIDVPQVYHPNHDDGPRQTDDPLDGSLFELNYWANHYKTDPTYAYPGRLLREVHGRFGRGPMPLELSGDLKPKDLERTRRQLLRIIEKQTELAVWMLTHHPSEFFLMPFSAPHRGGHLLWDETGLAEPANDSQRSMIRGALKELYQACDRGLGRILEAVEDRRRAGGVDESTFQSWTFALHGMGPHASPADLLPEMLDRVLSGRRGPALDQAPKRGWLAQLRGAVPLTFRSAVKNRLPFRTQMWLTQFWRRTARDWSRTRAFCLYPDNQGYIRINLKGREREGVVQPGEAYDALCERIATGLKTFRDAATGRPIVTAVRRADELYASGEHLEDLPDLIVAWTPKPVAEYETIVSEEYGSLQWPTPGRVPDGRSGHHRFKGWLIAHGAGLEPGSTIEGAHILDLAPTVLRRFGQAPPASWAGRPITALAPTTDRPAVRSR